MPQVGIFKAETSHIPGNEAPVSRYYFAGRPLFFTGGVSLLISRLSTETFPFSPAFLSSLSLPPLSTFLSYNALFTRILLVDKFFFFLVARSAWVARWGTVVYFSSPHAAVADNLASFWDPCFGSCEVSPPRRLSRGQVRFTRMRTLCRLGYVTARWHLCREHPKEPTTPDPRGPLSLEEFEIARRSDRSGHVETLLKCGERIIDDLFVHFAGRDAPWMK